MHSSNLPALSLSVIGLDDSQYTDRIVAILCRHLKQRCSATVSRNHDADLRVVLQIDADVGAESFRILPGEGKITITGGDVLGVLAGVGKFLRSARFVEDGLIPAGEGIESKPALEIRGMYFATHFHNYYHHASLAEVVHYLEDLALWGVNVIQMWFDMHHYTGLQDPAAQAMIGRLRSIIAAARELGVRICLVHLGNEAYADSPPELRADFNTGRATYDVELCPHKDGAMELLLRWYDEVLCALAETAPDFVTFGPYDQGGCACDKCKPWGANGYLKIAQAKAELTHARFPDTKIILSTWLFDYGKDQGEWVGLADAFTDKPDWCDYIQADSHETFPAFPLEHGTPGGLPLLNFPEISMWMMHPWGGFGANPLPQRFTGTFEPIKQHISGGFPYSEGIYEDINKVLWLQWYWNPERDAYEILREYIAYEYSPDVVDDVLAAIKTLEKNHNHLWTMNWQLQRQSRFPIIYQADPGAAFEKMQRADAKLSASAKSAWRWRILYLRALLDFELHATQGYWGNEACERAFEELSEIYYAQGAEYKCTPPTTGSIRKASSSERSVTT